MPSTAETYPITWPEKNATGHIAFIGVNNALIIAGDEIDNNFIKAASNIRNLDILSHQGLNVYDIVRKDNLIIIDDALKHVEERLLWV